MRLEHVCRVSPAVLSFFSVLAGACAPSSSPLALPNAAATPLVTIETTSVDVAEPYGGPELDLPIDLAKVAHLESVQDPYLQAAPNLGEEQRRFLSQHGFVVVPADWPEFYDLYEGIQDSDRPVYLTTDAVLRAHHLVFNRVLRGIEDEELAPRLDKLTEAMVRAAEDLYRDAVGSGVETEAKRVWAFFTVAQNLVSANPPTIPEPVGDLVDTELALIEEGAGLSQSPVMSFADGRLGEGENWQDYSQYLPRGHYALSEPRQRYFRAISWYGRTTFRLSNPQETLMAILVTRLLHYTTVNGEPAMAVWRAISEPTTLLVGLSDDLGVDDYAPVMSDVFGGSPTLNELP